MFHITGSNYHSLFSFLRLMKKAVKKTVVKKYLLTLKITTFKYFAPLNKLFRPVHSSLKNKIKNETLI
jgi:hypothetical protein